MAPLCSAPPLQVEVSPLENAISVVENKNQELRTLIGQYQHKQLHANVNLLSMTLNGVVDAAVNGGVARYQEVRAETTSDPLDPLRPLQTPQTPSRSLQISPDPLQILS